MAKNRKLQHKETLPTDTHEMGFVEASDRLVFG
jgi:hypothetical protein